MMKSATLVLAAMALLLGNRQASAGYITFDPLGSTGTTVSGVSGSNIVGSCRAIVSGNAITNGFIYNSSTSS